MRLAPRTVVGLVAFAAVVCFGRGGEASPRRGARIAFARSPDAKTCVGPTGLEEDVKKRLGWNPFALRTELTAEGIFEKNGSTWEAHFVVKEGDRELGARTLRSHDVTCVSLGEAVAVALTVAIDPDAPGIRLPDAVEEPDATRPSPPAPPPVPATKPRRIGGLALVGVAAGGLLPDLAMGGGLEGELDASSRVSFRLGAVAFPESRRRDFGFAITSLRGGVCFAPIAGARGRIEACAEVWGGLFSAFLHPSPILVPSDVGTSLWAGGDLAALGRVNVAGPVEVAGKASLFSPLVRRQAFVEGRSRPEWEQAPIGFTVEVGLGVRFLGF